MARYVTSSSMQAIYSAVPEFYRLLPLTCVLQGDDTDDELESVCSCLLAVLAHCLVLDQHVPTVLEVLKSVTVCPFWSARAVILEFIQVFVFHNMATIISNESWIAQIQAMVLLLLEDGQPEVRMKASHVLSDFLHCQFILNPDDLLVSIEFIQSIEEFISTVQLIINDHYDCRKTSRRKRRLK